MRGKNLLASGALLLGVLALPSAWAIDPATLANAGTGTIAACASCHGKDGGGQASFPRLAGMNATYLLKQLGDFDSGARSNAVMQPIAKALSPEDRVAITSYYAEMPVPAAQTGPAPAPDPDRPGEKLALLGKWNDGIPACVQCHGPGGIGIGDAFPAIAAQPAGYITAQLRAWQAGTRKNDPIELMRHLSAKLSASDIKAVSEWFSRQPATAAGGSR
ncbi:c-type cytochrome [Novilysobacter arseniciresistens]|nr:c-type cytochrome [Lysobacter arseniciresistens]